MRAHPAAELPPMLIAALTAMARSTRPSSPVRDLVAPPGHLVDAEEGHELRHALADPRVGAFAVEVLLLARVLREIVDLDPRSTRVVNDLEPVGKDHRLHEPSR